MLHFLHHIELVCVCICVFLNYFALIQVAASSLESSLLKYSAKEYMFRAALCHLCVDLTNSKIAVEKYEEMYPAFQDSRECKLLKVCFIWQILFLSFFFNLFIYFHLLSS